jgi:hypothetical protein
MKTSAKEKLRENGALLQQRANELFRDAMNCARILNQSFLDLGKIASNLRQDALWKNITDSNGGRRFRQWTEVLDAVLGPMSRKRAYDVLSCYELTQGDDPIPPAEVKQMGITRASQLARLDPQHRTPELRKAARTQPAAVVRNRVQAKLNENLPPDEQRPATALFAINLSLDIIDELEELLEEMIHLEGIRDGDSAHTMRQKAMGAMVYATRQFFFSELEEARNLRAAKEGLHNWPANAEADFPENAFPDVND